ncbi:MAG: metallophosphoesterase [Candidatus Odinarchaeota archaeon]
MTVLHAISDLHLPGSKQKRMDEDWLVWTDHVERTEKNWKETVSEEDIVLIPGDISWALKPLEAQSDLKWLDGLPGRKILLKGNHDYWIPGITKLQDLLEPYGSLSYLDRNHFFFELGKRRVGVAGTRAWASWKQKTSKDEKIIKRELSKLETSLDSLPDDLDIKLVMTHFPPTARVLENEAAWPEIFDERFVEMMAENSVSKAIFGHLHTTHNVRVSFSYLKIDFRCVSADLIDFKPVKLL